MVTGGVGYPVDSQYAGWWVGLLGVSMSFVVAAMVDVRNGQLVCQAEFA